MERIGQIRKAIVAVVGLAVAIGVLDAGVEQDVVAVLTAAAVYLIPNS